MYFIIGNKSSAYINRLPPLLKFTSLTLAYIYYEQFIINFIFDDGPNLLLIFFNVCIGYLYGLFIDFN